MSLDGKLIWEVNSSVVMMPGFCNSVGGGS